ncbi:MAG: hypothetical protein HRU34_18055 [Richelia sp.]|nr:hypothetical protein [Richelia sp.]CDN16970.1 FIG00871735: hypothetical protein [Richelia intracellularis]
MGRWTPLILMAGGLAILMGTLLGITFPMDGQQSANKDLGGKDSRVLPANINVNSTATNATPDSVPSSSVAQNNNPSSTTSTKSTTDSPISELNQTNNEPIRALW